MKTVCIVSDTAIQKHLNRLDNNTEIHFHNKQNLKPHEVIEFTKDAEILITGPEAVGKLDKEIIDQLPNLKHIALLTIGTNWLDIDYIKSKGITVSNIPGATAQSVAEHAWAMVLSLAKRVSEFDRAARYQNNFNFADFKGKEVYGKTLGVIGLGNIGKKVAEIGKAFSMNILGVHSSMAPVNDIKIVTKNTLLENSDVIILCLPLNESTTDYINTDEIALMKDGVILVNPAREKLVNKDAIVNGLRSGKVFGYGVETPIMQPIPTDDPYYMFNNIIVTPHNAFNTYEADDRSYEMIVNNVLGFINGRAENLV